MPQSSSDVFSPRQRLPLDPFAAVDSAQKQRAENRLWEVDPAPRSGLQPQVVLVLGEPRPSDILPLLTSPHLSHSLVLIATHAPGSLAIPATLPPGPAVRVLRLAASLNVHDAGALRLVNVLERAQRVARLWRHSAKGKAPAGALQRIIQLAQDVIDGEFTVVEPFAFTVANDDQARKPVVTTTSAQSQNQSRDHTPNPKAEQRSSLLYPSPPPSIASVSDLSIPTSPTPKKAAQTPASKSRFSILSLSKSPSSTSLRDSQSPKQKKLHKSSAQLSQLVKESAQAVEDEQVLLSHYQSHGISGQAHTRTFDAIVNFLPAGGLPDKALLKCAILVTTLSAQYLALPPGSSGEHITEEDGEEERNGAEQGSAPNFEGRSHSSPAHIHATPTKKPIKASDSASNTISTSSSLSSSTSPPSSFTPLSSTPTQKPHRYHYQRRSSLLASGSGSLASDGSLPIPPPMASYPSSSSSVVSKEPQSSFSMKSVFSRNSPSSSSSVPTVSRPQLHLHTSSSAGTSRSSLWAQAPPSNLTSSQTTPVTSPLPSPGLSALPGVPLEVDLVNDDISNGVAVGTEQVTKRKKSIKHRFSMIFGGRPDVQWKPPTQTQLHGDAQRSTSTRKKSMSGSTRPRQRTLLAVNAHIVHVLPQGWTPPEDAYPSSQNRRHSYASSLSSASGSASGSGSHYAQYHQRPSHYRSGSGESAGSTFGKPKLVQGIEQFLLSFAINVHQPGHDAYSFSSPGFSRVKAGKRPMTSSGIVSSGGSMKGEWSSPGTRSMSMTKGQLASLVEAEGKKEKEKNGKYKRNGRGPPVPFLIAPGGFGRLLMGGGGGEGGKEDVGQEVQLRLTIGELVLLGGLDAQSAGRAWVDVEDVVVLGGGDRQMAKKEVVSVPGPITVLTLLSNQDQPQLHSSPIEMDSLAEDQAKPESDEGTTEVPAELGASLLPTPPNSQSSSVRSRSQSHSGTSSEESAAAESEEADAEVEVEAEAGQIDDLEAPAPENLKATKEINPVDNQASKSPAVHLPYPTPPERIYSSDMQKSLSGSSSSSYPHDALQHQQYAEPPMMITLTSPTVGSPSPPPHHGHHRRLASNESASASTSALPLSGPPPSSWHGQLPNVDLETAGVPHKDVKVPRAIYVSSGSVSSSSRSKSDSRLPLPRMDVPPSSLNFKSEADAHPASGRKRVKSHDGFGSALRKLGLGMFGRTGGGSMSRER